MKRRHMTPELLRELIRQQEALADGLRKADLGGTATYVDEVTRQLRLHLAQRLLGEFLDKC